MNKFNIISNKILKSAKEGTAEKAAALISEKTDRSGRVIVDSLMHPEKYGPVVHTEECECGEGEEKCRLSCLFDAINRDAGGQLVISPDCTGCGECIENCESHALSGRVDLIPLVKLLSERRTPVYAMIAPAFSGQFSDNVTSGKLRSAFKATGFYGMIEVALFADILTLKEALEFDRAVTKRGDFMLTSCCCPMWVALIRKKYSSLIPHVPPSVSPMVACGRSIKRIHPEAATVFVGPCIAKKAEAKNDDIADAVDYVITFRETEKLFETFGIDPEKMPEDESDHSSYAGRIYAKTSGVSEAVETTLERLNPGRKIMLKSTHADGMADCRQMLSDISDGIIDANFIEGMGCRGGCVGGPERILPTEEAKTHVEMYAKQASGKTPVDNPYVMTMLKKLGFDDINSLLDRDNTFTRDFGCGLHYKD